MDKNRKSITDHVASAIMSLGFVELAMIFITGGMVFFSHFLFFRVFPETMDEWQRNTASWMMALAWESTVMITTVNARHFGRGGTWFPTLMAICSGIIVLFFITTYSGVEPTILMIVQQVFVGVLAAVINAVFSHLFFKKVMERDEWSAMPKLVEQLKQQGVELGSKLAETAAKLAQAEAETASQRMELVQLRAKLEVNGGEDTKCPYCGEDQETRGGLISHKGKCKMNPKKAVQLNGHVHI